MANGFCCPKTQGFQPVGVGLAVCRSERGVAARPLVYPSLVGQEKGRQRQHRQLGPPESRQKRMATAKALNIDPEDSSLRAQLLQERAHLYAELKELEFDFQAGKLAESDYEALKLRSRTERRESPTTRLALAAKTSAESDR